MEKVKVAVIGVGHHGQHHARIFFEDPNCELVGVVDIDRKQAKHIARVYKSHHYNNHQKMFGKVDAVSIAVPTNLHYQIAKEFLLKGVHVMIEKPITQRVEEAQDLISIAKKNNLVLQVGHIERFNIAVQKLREILKRPGFIEAHRLGPYDPRVKDIGVVMDLMIHDIDIVLEIVQSPIISFDAVGMAILSDKEDIANVRIKFQNGCTANITTSRVTPRKMRKIRIFQEDCYISLDYIKQAMEIHKREVVPNPKIGESKYRISAKVIRLKREEPLKLELNHFIECVQKGVTPDVTGEHAKNALEVVVKISELVQESMKQFSGLLESKEGLKLLPEGHPLKLEVGRTALSDSSTEKD